MTPPVAGGAIVVRGSCAGDGCSRVVSVEVPETAPKFLRSLAERMQSSGQLMCSDCAAVAEREEEAALRREQHEGVVAARRSRAGIPTMWAGQRFDGLEDDAERRRALMRAAEWARGDVAGLLLWGEPGRGKTAIAAAAANLRIERGPLRWLSVPELMRGLRMPFSSPEYAAAVRRLDARGRPALVLDDLDKSKATEHAVEPIFQAVNAWMEAELPLLVTLNRDLDALLAEWPEAFAGPLVSRLAGYCRIHHVGGRDRRLPEGTVEP